LSYSALFVGNPEVWHGSVDIIVKNELAIDQLDEDPQASPGGKSVEVKMKSSTLSKNPQLVAETIVFSFLQKKRHPELSNFLIPCVGIASNAMLLMFYDSEHDVLLESSLVPLYEESERRFSVEAVFITWLTVNYKFLCTGLTDEMMSYKAGFFEQAKEKLDIYKNNLKMPNVGVSPPIIRKKLSFSDYISKRQDRLIELRRKGLKPKEKK
jgi:hypothetical protein